MVWRLVPDGQYGYTAPAGMTVGEMEQELAERNKALEQTRNHVVEQRLQAEFVQLLQKHGIVCSVNGFALQPDKDMTRIEEDHFYLECSLAVASIPSQTEHDALTFAEAARAMQEIIAIMGADTEQQLDDDEGSSFTDSPQDIISRLCHDFWFEAVGRAISEKGWYLTPERIEGVYEGSQITGEMDAAGFTDYNSLRQYKAAFAVKC